VLGEPHAVMNATGEPPLAVLLHDCIYRYCARMAVTAAYRRIPAMRLSLQIETNAINLKPGAARLGRAWSRPRGVLSSDHGVGFIRKLVTRLDSGGDLQHSIFGPRFNVLSLVVLKLARERAIAEDI